MTTKLEVFGEADDYSKLKKKINTTFINLRIDDNKFQRFLFKQNFFLSNIIHLIMSIVCLIYFLLALYLRMELKIIITHGIGSLVLGTSTFLYFKILKKNIKEKNLCLQKFLNFLRYCFSISVYLVLSLDFFFCTSFDYSVNKIIETSTTDIAVKKISDEYFNFFVKTSINLKLITILFIKFFCFIILLNRMKTLIIIISVFELVVLFIVNYIYQNDFIIEIFFDLVSNIISYFIIYIFEKLNKLYYFYRQTFKKIYLEYIEKFRHLGIKNFLFNGDNIIDLNKTFDKSHRIIANKNTFNNNRNLIEEFKILNQKANFNSNTKLLNATAYEDRNESNEESKFFNFLNWLPSLNENVNEISDKREFLNKLIEYEHYSSLEEIKKEIFYEEIINGSRKDFIRGNENESINLNILRNNTIQYTNYKKLGYLKQHTLLDLLENLKYEFEFDKNYEKILDIDHNNPRFNRRLNTSYFEELNNFQNVFNVNLINKNIEYEKNRIIYNNKYNSNNYSKNSHYNQENNPYDNPLNYINNSAQLELLNGITHQFSNKLINKFNNNKSKNDISSLESPNFKNSDRIDRSKTFNYPKKTLFSKPINESFKNKRDIPYAQPYINMNNSFTINNANFNINNSFNINMNSNLHDKNNIEKVFRNKVKNFKIQSEYTNNFVFLGKYISKDTLKEEELNIDQMKLLQCLYFRTIHKVFFKKIIYKKKIYFELLIIEDVEYLKNTNLKPTNSNPNLPDSTNNNYLKIINNNIINSSGNNSKIANVNQSETINLKEFGKIAHELKTPLNAIIGLINDFTYTNKKKNIHPNLSSINSLANYLIFLISDLTQYANNFTVEDIQILVEKINLYDILNFCFDILKSLLVCKDRENSIKPILDFKENINFLTIKSDEVRLKQILLNLISNAVKFTKSGEIRIATKIKHELNSVKLSIKDTGIGMKDELVKALNSEQNRIREESIFNRFGSGFGLSIAKSLSEKLNISFKFKSKYQVGSTFSIFIPFEKTLTFDKSEKCVPINNNPKDAPTINIIKSTQTFKSVSLDISTRKNSNNMLIFNTSCINDKTDSSSNLQYYNINTERLTERKSTTNLSFKGLPVYIQNKSNHSPDANDTPAYVSGNSHANKKLKFVHNVFNSNGNNTNRSHIKMKMPKTGIDRKKVIYEGFNDSCIIRNFNIIKFCFF